MASPEFRINAKVTVDETSINWKTCRNTAKGHISLLDANDTVIQSFPFDIELRDAGALAKFAELISQEQIVKTLSETVEDDDSDDDAMDILSKLKRRHTAMSTATKTSKKYSI